MARRKTITPIYPYDPLTDKNNQPPNQKTNKSLKKSRKPDNNKAKGNNNLFMVIIFLAMSATIGTISLLVVVVFQISDLVVARNNQSRLMAIAEALEDSGHYPSYTHAMSAFDAEMRVINPNFVCWITVNGTNVDYPVVRASDNERYMNTSFFGERNVNGTIFMDYRNVGEYVPHIIIYGHNIADGSKFGSLRNFLDDDFLANYSTITLRVNDRTIEYEIFSVRVTDVNDPAYFLDFATPSSFGAFLERNSAPLDAVQILTLSTCVSRGNGDERLVVQGALLLHE